MHTLQALILIFLGCYLLYQFRARNEVHTSLGRQQEKLNELRAKQVAAAACRAKSQQ